MAVEKGDPEIVQLLLAHPSINVNVISVKTLICFILFHIIFF